VASTTGSLPARAWTERTYAELMARTGKLLERGESVILDASWTQARHRDMACDVAARTCSTLVPLRCDAAPDVIAARLHGRTNAISDADQRIAMEMAARADPLPDAHTIRTDRVPDHSVDQAAALVLPDRALSP
jgi:uncharacterized protein